MYRVGGRLVLQLDYKKTSAQKRVGAVFSDLGCGAEVRYSLRRERGGICVQKGAIGRLYAAVAG